MKLRTPSLCSIVAQIFNLPYRRIAFCEPPENPTPLEDSTVCRLQIGDTADYKSALRSSGTRAPLKFGVWCLVFGVLTASHHCFHAFNSFTLSNVF